MKRKVGMHKWLSESLGKGVSEDEWGLLMVQRMSQSNEMIRDEVKIGGIRLLYVSS